MPKSKWPPPGFPVVVGDHGLTESWAIHLQDKFARRVEDGCLVLWRPGLTVWLAAWGNDHRDSQAKRLRSIKKDAAPDRFGESESRSQGITRYSYRLREENEDEPVESLSAFILSDDGHLQMSVYFDDPRDEAKARALAESVVKRGQA